MNRMIIVVDMQKGFIKNSNLVTLEQKIRTLLENGLFDTVIATRFINGDDSVYEKLMNWKEMKEVKEIELCEGYSNYTDYKVDKSIYTCVNKDFIKKLCKLNNGQYPKEVYIVGVDTDCCVLTIATDLFENNIRPIVLTKYCESTGGRYYHEAGLLCMKRLIGSEQLVDKEILVKEDLDV